jgi:hypothetical protein
MNDVDQIRAIKRAAAARLHAIPGVHAVGVGFKVVGGKKTDEMAITVFVDKKKKPEDLAGGQLVPAELDGAKTDVVQMGRARLANADPTSITIAVATIPADQGGGQSITFSGPKIPACGLIGIIDLTVQDSGEDARQVFVSAVTDGRSPLVKLRDDLLDALKELDEVSPSSSDDPLQIQVLSVSDATVQVTNAYVLAEDDTKYFKDYVRGGIRIQRGSATPHGTLGIVATTAPTAVDPKGKVVGLTNVHVVCPSDADGTNLQVKSDDDSMGVTFDKPAADSVVDPDTRVVLMVRELDPERIHNILFSAFYVVGENDQPSHVANGLAEAATGTPAGLSIAQFPADSAHVALTSNLSTTVGLECNVYGWPNSDPKANLSTDVTKPDLMTNIITFRGTVSSENYGIFVKINPGRLAFTYGSFTNPKKGATPDEVATTVLQSITNLPTALLGSVTAASAGDAAVQINGAEEVECRIISDIQIGQPKHYFGSTCSHCCSLRIGQIVDAQIHSDVALIQLDPDLNYKLEIQDIGGGIIGVSSPTVGQLVEQRGFSSSLRHGSVSHIDVSTLAEDNGFSRLTDHNFMIDSDSDKPFVLPGDSGAAVVSNGTLVGLLWGHRDIGGIASDISPLVDAFPSLKLSFVPAAGMSPDTVQTVPKPAAAAFQALADDAAQAVTIPEAAPFGFAATRFAKRLDEAENEIRATPLGREYAEVVRRHLQEGFTLVNKNRRVATVWRRSGGPEILDGLARMIQFRNERLPAEINGKPLSECLSRIQRIVTRYASAAFLEDLNRYAPKLKDFAHMTYLELLTAFQSEATE